jgi:hypothetical protein
MNAVSRRSIYSGQRRPDDDTMDVWSAEDFKLVQDLSAIARWSNPDELADLLETA